MVLTFSIILIFAENSIAVNDLAISTLKDGFSASTIYSGGPFSEGIGIGCIAISPENEMFVAGFNESDNPGGVAKIYKVNLTTNEITTLIDESIIGQPDDMIIGNGSPVTGYDLILSDHNAQSDGGCCGGIVVRINRETGSISAIYEDLGYDPFGLALGTGGEFGTDLYVMSFQGESINPPVVYRVNSNGQNEIFAEDTIKWPTKIYGNPGPILIAFDNNGNYGGDLFAQEIGVNPGVWRIKPSGDISIFVEGEPGDFFGPVTFGSGGVFGTDMYFFGMKQNVAGIFTVSPEGELTLFAGFDSPLLIEQGYRGDLEFSPDGNSLYISYSDSIIEISETEQQCINENNGAIDVVGTSICNGATIEVPILLQNEYKPANPVNGNNRIKSFGFTISYDPEVLNFETITPNSDLLDGFKFNSNNIGNGKIIVGGFSSGDEKINNNEDGELCLLRFNVIDAQKTAVSLQDLVDDIEGWSTSSTCLTPPALPVWELPGDLNGNGEVTPLDARCAAQKAVGICDTDCGACETIQCDVNSDCDCSASDALCILDRYLKKDSCIDIEIEGVWSGTNSAGSLWTFDIKTDGVKTNYGSAVFINYSNSGNHAVVKSDDTSYYHKIEWTEPSEGTMTLTSYMPADTVQNAIDQTTILQDPGLIVLTKQ